MTDKPETVADVLKWLHACAKDAKDRGHQLAPSVFTTIANRIERAMAASAEHPHSSLRGTLVCDDCQSRDFNVYNEGAGVLFCRECGQYQKLKIAPPAVPVESPPASVPDGFVLIDRADLVGIARILERDGDEHGAARELRNLLRTTPEESP